MLWSVLVGGVARQHVYMSKELPGLLDIGHFWYPWEHTSGETAYPIDQVYVYR